MIVYLSNLDNNPSIQTEDESRRHKRYWLQEYLQELVNKMISKFLRFGIVLSSISLTLWVNGSNPGTSMPLLVSQTTADEIPNNVVISGERIGERVYSNDLDDFSGNSIVTPQVFGIEVTVVRNPISITLYDNSAQDGDIVSVTVNGKTIPGLESVLLTNAGQTFNISLETGVNTVAVHALNEGAASPCTATLVITPSQVVSGGNVLDATLPAGLAKIFTVGFPQIKVPFLKYPESALHILEAQAKGRPRLVTIDRPGAGRRRQQSIKNYLSSGGTPAGRNQDLDEYPQAVFLENGGNADVKPINRSDNRGSGSTIGQQIKPYTKLRSNKVFLDEEKKLE
ncbi:NucA/NucB deoxyribonuclease domain-containing protein, partial [Chroogloeocystis siderophila]